jgi:hypothetical protein
MSRIAKKIQHPVPVMLSSDLWMMLTTINFTLSLLVKATYLWQKSTSGKKVP